MLNTIIDTNGFVITMNHNLLSICSIGAIINCLTILRVDGSVKKCPLNENTKKKKKGKRFGHCKEI